MIYIETARGLEEVINMRWHKEENVINGKCFAVTDFRGDISETNIPDKIYDTYKTLFSTNEFSHLLKPGIHIITAKGQLISINEKIKSEKKKPNFSKMYYSSLIMTFGLIYLSFWNNMIYIGPAISSAFLSGYLIGLWNRDKAVEAKTIEV